VKITVLGCGGSSGVPLTGNQWGACDPREPRNRRRRSSILVEQGGTTILIDASPDLREQLLDAKVSHLDALVLTHGHADHTHGLDDLREINRLMDRAIPAYGDQATLDGLRRRFGYAFKPHAPGTLFARPVLEAIAVAGPFRIADVALTPFVQDHGYSRSTGYRIADFAYSTDVVALDETAFTVLAGIDTWVVDCVRIGPAHPVHAHLPLTLSWIERVRPRRAYLTHMNHTMDYAAVSRMLPAGVEPAYDGLEIYLPD
jgi:phosphoribosyl 1,2-cyclic phosphate phosphodiesterase